MATSLLRFNFDAVQFGNHGTSVVSHDTKERIGRALKKIQKIVEVAQHPIKKPSTDEPHIYRAFMRAARLGVEAIREEFDTIRKVRKLSYSLGYQEGSLLPIVRSQFLASALQIIESFWRYSMFLGLFDTLLKNWNYLNNSNGDLLRSLIIRKIDLYDGRRKLLKNIKNFRHFFIGNNSHAQLGSSLVNKNIELKSVCEYIGMSPHMINYGYFGGVAAAFTHTVLRKSQFNIEIIDISEFLKLHKIKATSKQCFSKIIPALDNLNNPQLQERIKLDALQLIGDPANEAYWEIWDGANEDDRIQLKKAQSILNEWLTREFISIFFEKLAMDVDRKLFWLKYVKNISRFRIYGSSQTKQRLYQDERIRPYLDSRFGVLQDATANQSALVMIVRDYDLVEFSLKGKAFYAYRSSNPLCPDISQNVLRSRDLIHPQQMPLLMRRQNNQIFDHRAEGRFSHYSGWQQFLKWWLKNYLGV